MTRASTLIVAASVLLARTVSAYELQTHAKLSREALEASRLNTDPRLLKTLELRAATDLGQRFPNEIGDQLTVHDLVVQGSVLEDNPFGSQLEQGNRVRNHFFDPAYSRGLTTTLVGGTPSPLFALEYDGQGQHFASYLDAHDEFFQGLTAATSDARDHAWGRTFSFVGHVVHHIEDMAQPQHTRNDPHAGWPVLGLGQKSLYEKHVEETYPGSTFAPAASAVSFETARDYWTRTDHRGMADFTNRNFVSEGTNFRGALPNIQQSAEYALPSAGEITLQKTTWAAIGSGPDDAGAGIDSTFSGQEPDPDDVFYFIGTPIRDGDDVVDFNARTSTFSVWDSDLLSHGAAMRFSYNMVNMNETAKRVLPRATAYSAGLVDHFFRGVLNANGVPVLRLHAQSLGSPNGAVSIENTSSEDLHEGTITVAYDDRSSGGRKILGSVPHVTIPAGQSTSIAQGSLDWRKLLMEGPIDGEIAVIFRGSMGSESDDVAARVCSCPAEDKPILPDDPANDCTSLCPCQYLSFAQGSPGKPDGVTVMPRAQTDTAPCFDGAHFINYPSTFGFLDYPRPGFAPLADLGRYPSGFTVTLFGDTPQALKLLSFQMGCGFGSGGAPGDVVGGVTVVNGREGRYVSFIAGDPDVSSCAPGVTSGPLQTIRFGYVPEESPSCLTFFNQFIAAPIDAVMVCAGSNAYPQ